MPDRTLYANVAFKKGGKKVFTYRIPPELGDQVLPGIRIRASFRDRDLVGFVIDVQEKCDLPPEKVLPLLGVVDAESRFTPSVQRLIDWTASYYQSTPGEAMRAAYPFPSFLRPKVQNRLVLACSPEEALGWIHEFEKRRPKQAEALRVLLAVREKGLTRVALMKRAETTAGTLDSLQKAGLVRVVENEVQRNPIASRPGQYTYKTPISLTEPQGEALRAIVESARSSAPRAFLLKGVTGSGKTEVYLRAIEEVLQMGRTALALVPEISLTPQTVDRFQSRFGDRVGILHSALGEGERFDQWRAAREGRLPVIVGTRSAIFCPLQNLGLIIVDEEHDSSYKQVDPAPRYHARDLAVVRGSIEGCPVVLGSATPSLESAYNASRGKYSLLTLPERVTGQQLPKVRVIDLRGRVKEEAILSKELVSAIEEHSSRRGQIILFLNRRGFSTMVICRKCGHVFGCPNCSVGMVYHQQFKALVCHHCETRQPEPRICPECKEAFVRYQGAGTEQVAQLVQERFPAIRVARMDLDTTRRKGAHGEILGKFRRGEIDLLVGTQMISKGLDFPGVSLVGVISADVSLNLPDFRAGEHTFSLLTQVSGRAGRGEAAGEVLIQSYSPRHYSIQLAIAQDYDHFYEQELKYRKFIAFPPVTRLTNLRIESEKEKTGHAFGMALGEKLKAVLNEDRELKKGLFLMGPLPAPLYRLKGIFRWHLTIKGRSHEARKRLLEAEPVRQMLQDAGKKVKVILDVDPLSML